MYITNHGETYSCVHGSESADTNSAYSVMPDKNSGSNLDLKTYFSDSGSDFDPVSCDSFYRDEKEPIWFGRVSGLTYLNQNLLVYGFLREKETLLEPTFVKFNYTISIRGKDSDTEEWTMLPANEETKEVLCMPDNFVCSWFLVAWLNYLEFDTYDVAIELLAPESEDAFNALEANELSFHIVYIDESYSEEQIVFRFVFIVLSAFAMISYNTKVFCRVPRRYQKQVTRD